MNYYELLEVSPNASAAVIRAAYKSLMQRYHPDKNSGNPAAAERASLVVQAYEVLSDSNKRSAYDLELKRQQDRTPPAPSRDRRHNAAPRPRTDHADRRKYRHF